MVIRFASMFSVATVLCLVIGVGEARADCQQCQNFPAVCDDLANCVKNCKVQPPVVLRCAQLKQLEEIKNRPAPAAQPPTEPETAENKGTQVSGRLAPEIIKRVIQQNFGRFRLCYENGLRNNPKLQGRVSVRFVIGRDGAVSNVSNGGSDMPDGGVVSCVVRAFYGLTFPQPQGGIVTVTYPIMFSPSS